MDIKNDVKGRLDRHTAVSVKNWQAPTEPELAEMKEDCTVDMGWGRILFGQTFAGNLGLYAALSREAPGHRDIAFYIRDPHVLLSMGPDALFLDPSHTYRLWSHDYRPPKKEQRGFRIRRAADRRDAEAVNAIYAARGMVRCPPAFMLDTHATRLRTYLVAESTEDGAIVGTVTGIDHRVAFNDPENGTSLWCLAVDPQANAPGVGEALARHLAAHYLTRGRNYVDLSVMHDNAEAIALYEKIGFRRVPVFCVKRKNPINEKLFTAPPPEDDLNPYARIIIDEARRRGIGAEIVDAENGYFRLVYGGRGIVCRESLTELTSAIAMCRCDDKRLTHGVLMRNGLRVPFQTTPERHDDPAELFEDYDGLVVKPARGEQGEGVSVGLSNPGALIEAINRARAVCPDVVIEEMVEGQDLRVIVIGYEVVAAAVRRPPEIVGDGTHTIAVMIEKYNRRRAAATGGECHLPVDAETRRCIDQEGFSLDSVLPQGRRLTVRKAANLHTGGTIHDVTDQLHPELRRTSVAAARAIGIPVTGLDLMVKNVTAPDYWIIEANERPGLANHEPQPTAERFMDLLFPQTATGGLS